MTACKTACLVALLALVTASCGRKVTYYKPPPVDGLRLFAISRITGGARDSLYVRVSARNDAKEQRRLESGVCGDPLTIRVYRGAASRRSTPIWDSDRWRRATDPPNQVCISVAIVRILHAGTSDDVAAFAIPVRAVLGDTVPGGRYRLTAVLNSSGAQAGEVPAGTIDLRVP